MKILTTIFTSTLLIAIPLFAQDRIGDVEVDEDTGEHDIADLDEAFADIEDDLRFEFFDAPDELNMNIDDDNVLLITPDDDYNLPDGADITIAAVMPDGDAIEDVFNLIVVPINDEPIVANAIEDLEVDENADLTNIADLEEVFHDVDLDELTYSFEGVPDEFNMEINDNNILQVHPEQDYFENDGVEVTVTAEDPDGETAVDVFILIILEEGRIWPPHIDNVRVDEDAGRVDIADLDVVFAGWEREIQEFRHEGAPEEVNMNIDGESNVLFFESDDDYNLNNGAIITVTAEDENEETVDLTFRLSIRRVNDAPVVTAEIEDVTVDEDSGETVIADLDEVFSDVDEEDEQLSFQFSGSPAEVNMRLDEENLLVILPEEDYNLPEGVEITVTATDSHDAQVEDEFVLTVTPLDEPPPNITYYLYFGTYIPDVGQGPVVRITPLGENVAEGEAFEIPDYDLEQYDLGDSFQIYMDAISGTTVLIEEGGIDEDIEVHLIMNNLIVTGGQDGEPIELAGIWSPDDDLQQQLWMFADYQVWTADEDSVQLNEEEDYEFLDGHRMVVNIPLNDEFRDMMDNLGLEYDSLGAGLWVPDEEDWELNGIESAEIEIGEESWFRIALSHLSIIGGGPEGGFGELDVPNEKLIPQGFILTGAFPNPFNNRSTVNFNIPKSGNVKLVLYDIQGREAMMINDGSLPAGAHNMTFNASNLSTGAYLLKLDANGETQTVSTILMK